MLSIDGNSLSDLPRPVALWHGDGNFVDSVSGIAAIPGGGVTATTGGLVGNAFQFDGVNDAINLGNRPELNLPGNMTLSMKVRFDRLNGGQWLFADFDPSGILSQGSLGQSGNYLNWHQTTDYGFHWSDPNNGRLVGVTALQTNRWYDVAIVRNDATKTVSMYLDGNLETSRTYYGNVLPVQQTRMLGVAAGFPGTSFGGSIDEVAIYDRALTPGQLRSMAQPPKQLTDSSAATLATLPNLEVLSLSNQALTRVEPIVQAGAKLSVLNLDGNAVTNIAPLIGEQILALPNPNPAWTTNIHPVSGTFGGDYVWFDGRSPSAASDAIWNFGALEPGDYEIFANWLPGLNMRLTLTLDISWDNQADRPGYR